MVLMYPFKIIHYKCNIRYYSLFECFYQIFSFFLCVDNIYAYILVFLECLSENTIVWLLNYWFLTHTRACLSVICDKRALKNMWKPTDVGQLSHSILTLPNVHNMPLDFSSLNCLNKKNINIQVAGTDNNSINNSNIDFNNPRGTFYLLF